MKFDQFSESLADESNRSNLNTLMVHHNQYVLDDLNVYKFPFNPKESEIDEYPFEDKNLKCSQEYIDFINEENILNIYDRFIDELESNVNQNNQSKEEEGGESESSQLEYLEKGFRKRVRKMIAELKEKGLRIEIEREMNRLNRQVHLHNITNYYAIGINIDRPKNDRSEKYRIFDSVNTNYVIQSFNYRKERM